MTSTELNELGFEGDSFLRAEFENLIKEHKIDSIIETGTYMGATTLKLAGMVKRVITIEVNAAYFNMAVAKFTDTKNIGYLFGDSAEKLPDAIGESTGNILFFLDAHWGPHNPLLSELKVIAHAGLKPVIVIHDFKVPDNLELGFDSYNGQDYEWPWIEKSIQEIYGENNFTYYYNTQAEGAKRGVIFIEPK